MGLPKSVSGASYLAMWQSLADAAMAENGLEAIGELPPPLKGSFVARLSNGQAVAVVNGWRRAASRSRVPWPAAVDLSAYALGQRGAGQRFDMSDEHMKAPLDADALVYLWASTAQLAEQLDDSGTVVRPLPFAWTRDEYERGARETWEVIKAKGERPTPEQMEKMLKCAARPWLPECNENTLPTRLGKSFALLAAIVLGGVLLLRGARGKQTT